VVVLSILTRWSTGQNKVPDVLLLFYLFFIHGFRNTIGHRSRRRRDSSAVVILFNGYISRKDAEAQKGIFLRAFAPLRANFCSGELQLPKSATQEC